VRGSAGPAPWMLLYAFETGWPTALEHFTPLVPPADRYWADPHVVHVNGRYYVFLEEFMYETRRGHIAVLELDEAGRVTPPVTVLERPYHLSYPHLFRWEDTHYLIPETRANRTIEVYRCLAFPQLWERHAVLMHNVEAVDTTLFAKRIAGGCLPTWATGGALLPGGRSPSFTPIAL
jgi:hypothetical protein